MNKEAWLFIIAIILIIFIGVLEGFVKAIWKDIKVYCNNKRLKRELQIRIKNIIESTEYKRLNDPLKNVIIVHEIQAFCLKNNLKLIDSKVTIK
jgi:hypothetical protein